MRIVVADATSASALAERLTVAFGANRISRWADPPEVGVRCGRQADRTVLRVLNVVDGWLDQAGAGFADMQLGERSYRIARWAPVENWQPSSSSNGEGAAVNVRTAHPIATDEQTNGARSQYWLEHSDGFQVFGPDGRIGFVARVLSSDEGVAGLVVRTGLLRTRRVFVPAREVRSVLPRRQRLELLHTPRAAQPRVSEFVRELFSPAAEPSTGNEAALVPFASDGKG